MQIGLGHLGKIKVDHNIDSLNINSPGKQIATHKITAKTRPEVMEDTIAVSLSHLSMDVVAGIAKFCDLFGKQLHPLCRIAENDALKGEINNYSSTLVDSKQSFSIFIKKSALYRIVISALKEFTRTQLSKARPFDGHHA